jgi:diguanylate cyclase (GGDEF)-like protein
MKRYIPAFAIIFVLASAAWAAAPATLTTLSAVHALSNAEASQNLPVAFEATVTFSRRFEKTLFVQDGNAAIYVQPVAELDLVPGDRVLVRGTAQPSFRPYIKSAIIVLLHHGALPRPVPANFDELIQAKYDSRLVTVHGAIRAADLELNSNLLTTRLQIVTDGGYVDATVNSKDPTPLKGLLDAEVEITGISAGLFDGKMQQTGILLHVSSLADVKILKRANASPWSLPVTPMNEILTGYHVSNLTRRVRISGTITYYQPGSAAVLQDGTRSMWVMTRTISPLRIGDLADATGIPDVHDGFLALTRGEIQDSQVLAPIGPRPANWKQLASSGNIFDLVSIEGQVVMAIREAAQDEYFLMSDGHLFSAIYRHPDLANALQPMKQIPLGSKVRVAGICVLEGSNPFDRDVPFNILLRSPDDLTVVAEPSLLTVRNLIIVVFVLLLTVVAVGARSWSIERKARRQTAALAYIEQRRSRILEDINGSRPLAEIIEEITELVSFKLHGAPCWCQIADGALLGNRPTKLTALRSIHHEIPARSGPPLGDFSAAFDPLTKPRPIESEALSTGAALAALAIETRRLYSDLRRRSEFDLLTDIHNRFSMDKQLDALIEEARMKAGIFGLIYIDLDEFKQVNDVYGHKVGDLYLQEVALRMKRQLRGGDMLARLGGDEFAVLVPLVHNRAEAQEIAGRLERSFDEPFAFEGYFLHGSASVGLALYPEDGATKDSLLSAADAAMYVEKNIKKETR